MGFNKSDIAHRVLLTVMTEQLANIQIQDGMTAATDFLKSKGIDLENDDFLPLFEALDMVAVANRSLGMSEAAQLIFGEMLKSDLIPDTEDGKAKQESESDIINPVNAFYL